MKKIQTMHFRFVQDVHVPTLKNGNFRRGHLFLLHSTYKQNIYLQQGLKGTGLGLVSPYKESVEMWTAVIFSIVQTFEIVIDFLLHQF